MPAIAAMGAIAALLQAAVDGIALLQSLQADNREPTPAETLQLRALADAEHRIVQGE